MIIIIIYSNIVIHYIPLFIFNMLSKINISLVYFLIFLIIPFMGFSNSSQNSSGQCQEPSSINKESVVKLQSQIANIQAEINYLNLIT